MENYQVGLIAVVVFAVALMMVAGSWRQRMNRQAKLFQAPKFTEFLDSGTRVFYVATTLAGQPLERVIAHGLGYRGWANILVNTAGISIMRIGESSFEIPFEDLIGIDKSSSVIDKAVERDGLVVINWKLGDKSVESYLRFVGKAQKEEFVKNLKIIQGEAK